MSTECENLDAFLADDLPSNDCERYEGHLVACQMCREAVNQQRWIDALLSSPARVEAEPAPPVLTWSVQDSIASQRRKVRLIACGLTAAAVLIIAVGWSIVLNRQARLPAVNQIAETSSQIGEPSPALSPIRRGVAAPPGAVFVGGPEVLAVPVASRHPNVTIVRVYPTYQSGLASQAASDDSDADYFNGG